MILEFNCENKFSFRVNCHIMQTHKLPALVPFRTPTQHECAIRRKLLHTFVARISHKYVTNFIYRKTMGTGKLSFFNTFHSNLFNIF